jgi:hypothetical protein
VQKVPLGTAVRRPVNDELYLVVNLMDGSGRLHLVNLRSGLMKYCNSPTEVFPVEAEIVIIQEVMPWQASIQY